MAPSKIDFYSSLPYRIEVAFDPDGNCWSARIPDLPGLVAAAERWEELGRAIDDAKRAWFEAALAIEREIPSPAQEPGHSGRVLLRMPRSLHGDMVRLANAEGVSLNQLIVSLLSRAAGEHGASPSPQRWFAEVTGSPAERAAGSPPARTGQSPRRQRREMPPSAQDLAGWLEGCHIADAALRKLEESPSVDEFDGWARGQKLYERMRGYCASALAVSSDRELRRAEIYLEMVDSGDRPDRGYLESNLRVVERALRSMVRQP